MLRLAESLWYEDAEPGRRFETRSHTVTDGDIERFAELTFDRHQLHRDDEFARTMGFPRRIAHGLYGLSLMEGLKSELGLYETTSVASIGWDDVRFRAPIVSGDTVRVRVRLESRRISRSNPARGVVTEIVELVNHNDEVVISGTHATLLVTRAAGVAA